MNDLDRLNEWIGRHESTEDVIAPDRVRAMAATLDHEHTPVSGDELPAGWHWMFFNLAARARDLGPDGHPKRGGFLPPVPLPRRMWAGGRLAFSRPLRVGERVRRDSEIADLKVKQGRSGALVFVVVRHVIAGESGPALEEEHDIVYREAPRPDASAPAPERAPLDAAWRREVRPDPVLLFRYSALTFNGHRIHYDQPYVTKVEGYPGLIVHGPLIATLLLDHLRANMPGARLRRFEFRALSPLFDTAPFGLNGAPGAGGTVRLWAAGPEMQLAMTAIAYMA